MSVLIDGYWCESVVASPDAREEWVVGEYRAASPDEALSWLLRHAGDLACALGPEDGTWASPLGGTETSDTVAGVFRNWSHNTGYHLVQLDALDSGQHISVNVRCWDRIVGRGRVELIYRLSVRPIKVTFGAERRVCEALPGGARSHPRGQRAGVTFLASAEPPELPAP